MKWASAAAVLLAGLIVLWMIASAGTLGTPHEYFYFHLPAAFLGVPLLILLIHWAIRGSPRNEEVWGGIGCSALILNFILFLGYVMMSGGGM
jgi:hypothetical protein